MEVSMIEGTVAIVGGQFHPSHGIEVPCELPYYIGTDGDIVAVGPNGAVVIKSDEIDAGVEFEVR